MAALLDLIDATFGELLWIAAGTGTILAYAIGKRALSSFFHWRLDRRLARSDYILIDELREYQQRIGDRPEPIDGGRIVRAIAIHLAQLAVPAAMAYAIRDGHWKTTLAAIGIVAAYYGWRWINDPPELRPRLLQLSPDMAIPKEAILGAIGAFALVAILLLLMIFL